MMTDEAQMCKTGGPEMAVELTKINRWAVTGTPLSSSFDDLVSQLYFIELEPFMTVKPCSCGAFVLNLRVVLHAIGAGACHVHVASDGATSSPTPSTRCPTQKDGIWGGFTGRRHKSSSAAGHSRSHQPRETRHVEELEESTSRTDEVTLAADRVQRDGHVVSRRGLSLYAHRRASRDARHVLEKELRARKAEVSSRLEMTSMKPRSCEPAAACVCRRRRAPATPNHRKPGP